MAQQDVPWQDYTYQAFSEIAQMFSERQEKLPNIMVSIKGGENRLTAKSLLRYYQAPRDVERSTSLAQELFINKEISFWYIDPETGVRIREIFHTIYGGGDICDRFNDHPWLLDILFDMAQGLLIKKLMPPSFDFGKPESGSEESSSPQPSNP